MAQPQNHVVHGGVQCPPPETWIPFEWEDPERGKLAHGEVSIVRPFGTSGTLSAGFWRTSATSPGCRTDGYNISTYSSPLGDETACVIDGTVTLTVLGTGQKFRAGPGSIISSPKGFHVEWEIDGPFFKRDSGASGMARRRSPVAAHSNSRSPILVTTRKIGLSIISRNPEKAPSSPVSYTSSVPVAPREP